MTKTGKIIIIVLSVLLIATGVTTGIFLGSYVKKANDRQGKIDGLYEKSYHETMDSLKNAETKLSKVNVLSGSTIKRELLTDVWKECGIAVTNLGQLGMDGEETETVTKFLNQVGDYAYYLSGKLATGKTLSIEEKENVKTFRGLLGKLRSDFAGIEENMTSGERFSAATLSDLSAVRDAIKSYSSIDYPELIYDGPFSDGLNDREAKFLNGQGEITSEQAVERVKELFSDAQNVSLEGETAGSIPSYVVGFDRGNVRYSVFLSKLGGCVASINGFGETDDPQVTEEECVAIGEAFLRQIGYGDMACVWVYNDNSTVYVNYAFEADGVVFYPDLIKVKVSANDGVVLGVEAMNYLYNHGEREIEFDASAESSMVINDELIVSETRYCVIPTEWNEEIYCKEVAGEYEGSKYYLYYDLSTGEEIRAMVVIDDKLL